jgi:hypothetical protein
MRSHLPVLYVARASRANQILRATECYILETKDSRAVGLSAAVFSGAVERSSREPMVWPDIGRAQRGRFA